MDGFYKGRKIIVVGKINDERYVWARWYDSQSQVGTFLVPLDEITNTREVEHVASSE